MYRVWIQGRFKKPGNDIFEKFGPVNFQDEENEEDMESG